MPTPSPRFSDAETSLRETRTRIERLASLLDTRLSLPGTGIRFGLDGLLGLIPGVGDAATALPLLYFLYHARRLDAPRSLQLRMVGHTAIDFLLGSIPVVGDLFDFAYKSHDKNARLLLRHIDDRLES